MARVSTVLPAAVLFFCFLLPSLVCDKLRCYYSPILETERKFKLVVTECPPKELCFKGDGRYGNHSALSARGCMAEKDCSRRTRIHLKGTLYIMTYACCEWPYCNSCRGTSAEPFTLLMLVAVAVTAGRL